MPRLYWHLLYINYMVTLTTLLALLMPKHITQEQCELRCLSGTFQWEQENEYLVYIRIMKQNDTQK